MAARYWLMLTSLACILGALSYESDGRETKYRSMKFCPEFYLSPAVPGELAADVSAVGAKMAVTRLSHLVVTARRGPRGKALRAGS